MAGDVLNVLSGFMKGRNKRRQEDLQLEQLKLQTQSKLSAEKIALEKEKRAAAKDAQEQKFMDMFMQQFQGAETTSPGTSETTPMGDSFPEQEGPSLLDSLSRGQMGDTFKSLPPMESMIGGQQPQASPMGKMSPIAMALMKKFTDIDMLGAGSLEQRIAVANTQKELGVERNEIARSNLGLREKAYDRGFTEGEYKDVTNEDGSVDRVWVPKFMGGSIPTLPGGQRPTIPAKPGIKDMPIPEGDRPFYINPETMERAPVGVSPEEAEALGLIRVAPTQLEKVQKIEAVKSVLDEVELIMTEVIPKEEMIGRVGGIARGISSQMQITKSGQKLAVLKDYITANRAQVAKALGEVGNLSETEQEAVTNAFGAITDAGPKAWMQFELLKKTFEKAKRNAFGQAKNEPKTTQRKEGESISDYLKRTGK